MTTDADGAKAFYDAVVGWDIKEGAPEFPNGYRMIGRATAIRRRRPADQRGDGGPRRTARWLGYIHVSDVDDAVAAIEAAGGTTWMAPSTFPMSAGWRWSTDPQGAPFYVMKPTPPADNADAQSDVFSPTALAARLERASDQRHRCRPALLPRAVRLGQRRVHGYGRARPIPFLRPRWNAHRGAVQRQRPDVRTGAITSAWIHLGLQGTAEAKGGGVHIGPHQVPGGDWISSARPARRGVRAGRRRVTGGT